MTVTIAESELPLQAVPTIADGGPEFTILMPCLNEAATLAVCIAKSQRSLAELNIRGEILIADNGSTDGSVMIAAECGAGLMNIASKGYGSAVMGGIVAARGRFVIMGDADDSYDFSDLKSFVEKLREGYDLVMGNRFAGGIKPGAMPPLHRYLGNPVLTTIGRLFFRGPCRDFHCGLRGFRRDAILKLDLRTTGMEFASEMVVKATLNRLRIAEVPTTLSPDGRDRPPHLRSWRDGWRHLRFLLMYSPRWLFLYPGLFLMALGTVIGLWLLPGPRRIGRVVLDIHTLMYASAAVLIGFQAISFALFAKVFAVTEGLLPDDPVLQRILRFLSLEVGLAVGTIMTVFGLFMSIWAVEWWSGHSFGTLDPTAVARLVIPAVTTLILGCQIVLSAFLLSILRLGRR